MIRSLKSAITGVLILLSIISCQKTENPTQINEIKWNLGSKQNYNAPNEIIPLPKGYEVKYISHLARHGSRFMSSPNEDIALFNLMSDAEQKNQLTEEGKALFEEVKILNMLQFGRYGHLTQIGRDEHFDMAQRLYSIAPEFFLSSQNFIGNATFKSRAKNSRASFIKGIEEVGVNVNWEKYEAKKNEDPLLRFHEISPKYLAYLDSSKWLNQINDEIYSDEFRDIAFSLLPKYFDKALLEKFDNRELSYLNGKGQEKITSQIEIILALYECFKISFAIPENQRPDFMIFTPKQTHILAKVGDIEAFYKKGPGFPKRDISYKNSVPLLMNLTHDLEQASQNDLDYQGYFNFAHAETTLPLSILLNINNCNTKTDRLVDKIGFEEKYATMGTNIQWFLLEKNKQQYIQIRFNEEPAILPLEANKDGLYKLQDYLDYVNQLIAPYTLNNKDYKKIVSDF